jgi:uncharacterized membrane protein
MERDNVTGVLTKFAQLKKIPVTPERIANELLKHPDYPSLLSISDVLSEFSVENIAFAIDYNDLSQLPCPFITYTKSKNGSFVIVDQFEGDKILITDESRKKYSLKTEEFEPTFGGVVLSAEYTATVSLWTNLKNRFESFKTPLLFAGALLLLVSSVYALTNTFQSPSTFFILLLLVQTLGLAVSTLLLIQLVDRKNPLVNKVCQTVGKTNCSKILNSNASKIAEWLSWSEIGFFYFAGTWLLLIFGGTSKETLQALLLLNALSLPYTIYSISYQAFIAKSWCTLCCLVQIILWLEFITLLVGFHPSPAIPGSAALCRILICLFSVPVTWYLWKPLFIKSHQFNTLKAQNQKLKYNHNIFQKLLQESACYIQPDESWCIVLGSDHPNHIITMATNPYCSPCVETHAMLHALMKKNSKIQARIVMSPIIFAMPASLHQMALKEKYPLETVNEALHDWYTGKYRNYKGWAKIYPVTIQSAECYALEKLKNWYELAEIKKTPTILIDGRHLPDGYHLSDLTYMLD